jgi:hypothetical protein
MIVEISTDVMPYDVVISSDKPEIITAVPAVPFTVTIDLKKDGIDGMSGGSYTDVDLFVTEDGQTEFNIFEEPTFSNLFINDCIFFKDKSYQIENFLGNWRLVWLNEFLLTTNDLLIFRKT